LFLAMLFLLYRRIPPSYGHVPLVAAVTYPCRRTTDGPTITNQLVIIPHRSPVR